MDLISVDARHPLRPAVEAAVRAVYAREYGARLAALPPRMLAWADDGGNVLCAAGLRTQPFFSEFYLDAPVEDLLARAGGRPVARERVVEVSALAAPRPGAAAAFTRAVIDLCREEGFDWAFFTATQRLRALLRWMGLPLVPLGPACPTRVSSPADWGSYYLHDPVVCAVPHALLPQARPAAAS